MKLFVVTSGSYSDYGISAIFTTQELAQEYIDKRNFQSTRPGPSLRNYFNDIEEYETDTSAFDKPQYIVYFDDGSLNIIQVDEYIPDYKFLDGIEFEIVGADDKEGAIKIAAENRARNLDFERSYQEILSRRNNK